MQNLRALGERSASARRALALALAGARDGAAAAAPYGTRGKDKLRKCGHTYHSKVLEVRGIALSFHAMQPLASGMGTSGDPRKSAEARPTALAPAGRWHPR